MKNINNLRLNLYEILDCICGECCTCDGKPPICTGGSAVNNKIEVVNKNNVKESNNGSLNFSISSFRRADIPLA
jgi:hypothetical protein